MKMSRSPLATYTYLVKNMSSGRSGKKIDKIFIHHMAGNLTVEQCGRVFNTRQASAHYGVNGTKVGCYVDENNTAWHCGNWNYNCRSIGIELANDGGAGSNWHVSAQTIKTAIALIVDICRRNGIDELDYTGDLKGNLCMHSMCANTACPGPYLKTQFKHIANEVNKLLNSKSSDKPKKTSSEFKVKVSIKDLYIRKGPGTGYANKGFIKPGVYTIVKTNGSWGKLKSGAGWISLKYAKRV